jgi:hypothetical protein
MGEDKKLTMQTIVGRKETKRLSFADGRYSTTGSPRSGGLASVYRARDLATDEVIALKVFRTGDGTDEVIEESFWREVQVLSVGLNRIGLPSIERSFAWVIGAG